MLFDPEVVPNISSEFHAFFDSGATCYICIDATGDNKTLIETVYNSGLEVFPLYVNTEFASLVSISPLLITLDKKNPITYDLLNIDTPISTSRGVFFASPLKRSSIIHHFQGLLEVHLPNLNFAFFRFYDARVMHAFIFGANEKGKNAFCSPFEKIIWPHYSATKEQYIYLGIENDNPKIVEESQQTLRITEQELENFQEIIFSDFVMKVQSFF